MLNSGKKIRALHDKKNKYSNSCVARQKKNILTLVLSEKTFLNETKNHNPPIQVKWSVPRLVMRNKDIYV